MSRSLKTCNEIMTYLIQQGFTRQVHHRDVVRAIIYVRGPDKRTIHNWMNALIQLAFLRLTEHKLIYHMNLERTPELITFEEMKQVYDDDKQTKLM